MRIGVIGAGRIAKAQYFPILSGMSGAEVCVMCAHMEKAEQARIEYGFSDACTDLDHLISFEPEMVLLLTPKEVRSVCLDPLLEMHIPVLCEKPLAVTLEECRHLENLSERTGTPLAVGFNRRYALPVLEARAEFGEKAPELVVCEKYKETLDCRATLENAIHMIDLLRFLCGECTQVEAQARLAGDMMHESVCTAQLSFESGAVGILTTSRCAGIWAERISLIGKDAEGMPVTAEIVMPGQLRVWRGGKMVKEKQYSPRDSGFEAEIEAMISWIHGKGSMRNTAKEALHTEILLDRILKSAHLPALE